MFCTHFLHIRMYTYIRACVHIEYSTHCQQGWDPQCSAVKRECCYHLDEVEGNWMSLVGANMSKY